MLLFLFYLAIFLILGLQKYLEIGCQIKFEENNLLKHGFLYEVKQAYVFDKLMYVSKEQALILAEADSASSSVTPFLF